jgi:3-dehydroquinate dehydratase-2
MPTTIWVLNGPNLNLLGTREPAIYGSTTIADLEKACRSAAQPHGIEIDFRQSNHEGILIDWLHAAGAAPAGSVAGVVLNAGAYTHTSVALHDAIKAIMPPVIEVHLSNVHAREPYRHHSYLSPACAGIVVGFGVAGYAMAIDGLARAALASTAAQKR